MWPRTSPIPAILLCLGCASLHGATDPAASDPPERDALHPALLQGIQVESHGARMNALVYGAAGAGPHPTLILLHGFPGNERNLDLAQAIRRAGWNVLFFHYRGAWGSEGDFSFSNALEDVAVAVDFAASREFAEAWRADPERIALLGHSMGGFMALTAGSEHERVRCIGSLAGANLGLFGRLEGAPRDATASQLEAWSGPLQGSSGEALVAETAVLAERFDLNRRAAALAGRPLYLAAGRFDRIAAPELHHAPLVEALRAVGPTSLRVQVFDADHSFSSRRIALARGVIAWLEDDCLSH
jgi:pimeloyl-ACP methyl ester carboxylesterase